MFKKLRTTCVVSAVALATILPGQASASATSNNGIQIKNNVSITINGETIQVNDPILNKSDFLLLPMRALYEAVGASVDWDKETLTASAIRNGKMVDLTIDSMTALIDGEEVAMDVAPFMYKDRTYMPLRFVSENFDGVVNWDEATQSVDITLSDETTAPPQEDPYILHINNKRIVMKDPIVSKDGRTYLPASYIYDYLDDSSGTWQPDGSFELLIGGMSFIFNDNSNQALVNNEAVTMIEKPFIQKGKMYIPAKFLVDALGGNLRYITEKKEMYIYVYRYMFTSPFLDKSYGTTSSPEAVPSARLEGDRDLFISDNPETLTRKLVPMNNATLAQYDVKPTAATNKHRVFGWHYNTLGTDVTLGITVQNKSTTESIKVTDSKGISQKTGNSWVGHDLGLSIADATLNNKLQKSESSGIVIAPGETKIIETYDLHYDYIIGFLHDLDIQAVNGGKPEYTIRTVLSKDNTDLTTIQSEQVAVDEYAKHPRGAWPSATILAELPAYTVDTPEVGYNISNGRTDHLQTAENSFSQINGAVGNPGHFGMNYKVSIPVVNPTGSTKTIKLKLAGRGGLYSGAIKVNGKVYLVPSLRVGAEYVELPDFKMKGSKDTIELELMHAGGVNLPVAIYVETK
ncbi:stalk domain-containing protein [Lysinibacillus capsici]|uniref:Stalk domain-containing protein n=1 Tax=Lysinibacillus capsici TaxID=2115968 RepID=A0ABY8KGR4_9BACI|nr:stalk domain-containing protein [Lysinibacillus capsici]WGF37623.1 stalk domain-containing protein [Lysinibacillus capsici]